MTLKRIADRGVPEFDTRERCSVLELLNSEDVPDLSVAQCRVKPGVTTELHALRGLREIYILLQGQGLMEDLNASAFEVFKGDSVVIDVENPQRITNTGTTDLIFLAVCTPKFTGDCYIPLEGD